MGSPYKQRSSKEESGAGTGRSTHFVFDHKVFAIKDAYFGLTEDTKEPVFRVLLGDLLTALPLKRLRDEFGIDSGSHDDDLLCVVEKGLRYVKEIRHRDSIPSELLDGTASWSIEEKHRVIALWRLLLKVSFWLSGGEVKHVSDWRRLLEIAGRPETRQRIEEATAEIAFLLGLPFERRREVLERIEAFGRELAYIEALRDRFALVKEIAAKLAEFGRLYSGEKDKSFREDIARVQTLLAGPVAHFEHSFLAIDAQSAKVLDLLRNFDERVAFIRHTRDDLHYHLRDWDEVIDLWEGVAVQRSPENEALIRETYRFAARNFSLSRSWTNPKGG